MKRLFYILFGAVLMTAMSCKKFLDKAPTDSVTPDVYYQNAAQLNAGLAVIYNKIMLGGYAQNGPAGQSQTLDGGYLYSDEAIQLYASPGTNSVAAYNFDYSNATVENLWQGMYQAIYYANQLLKNIDNASKVDTATRNYVVAQTRFLRGYAYYVLGCHFGGVPLRLENNLVSTTTLPLVRSSLSDTYAQAVADMEAAIPALKSAAVTATTSLVSQTAAQAILARTFLTMAGAAPVGLANTKYYDSTAYYARQVINSGQHALYTAKQGATTPDSSYAYIFINEARQIPNWPECLWEASFSGNDVAGSVTIQGAVGIFAGPPEATIYSPDYAVGYCFNGVNVPKPVYDLFGAGDLRRDWTICPYYYSSAPSAPTNPASGAAGLGKTNYATNTNYAYYARPLGKWRREFETLVPRSRFSAPESFPIIRYSDVLLMLAEADLMSPSNANTTEALSYVNTVRRRGYGLPINTVSATADLTSISINDIVDERTRELCFEGERWVDLRRWGLLQTKMQALQKRMETDGVPTAPSITLPAPSSRTMTYTSGYQYILTANGSTKFLLSPIPVSEMTSNTLCTQNPGW